MRQVVIFLTILMTMRAVPLFPAEPAQPTRADLLRIENTLERILTKNIIPFWYPQVIDREHGGYRLNHNVAGNWLGPANKRLVTQARTVWFFARLYNSPYGQKEHLDAARHGYEFLRDKMWDKDFAGFYSEVSSTSAHATLPDKHLYGESFGLYALTEYANASGDASAKQLASKLFDTLEKRAHDSKYGGYREFPARDWSMPPADARSYLGTGPDIKLYNTHLHLLEAMTTYYRLTKDPTVRERLVELIVINSNSVVRKSTGACSDQHARDWQPLHGPQFDRASYGHDIENVWLLMEACDAAGLPNGLLTDLYRTFYDYSMKYGYDRKNGGFYYSGPYNKPADDLAKSWWVQAEVLVSTLRMYQLTRDPIYFDCFRKTLDWVVKHQVDWEGGDWHSNVNAKGQTGGAKAGPWKSPYHNGRAMLECLETIESVLVDKKP